MPDPSRLTYSNNLPECGFSGAMDFLDGASETAEYAYDDSGNVRQVVDAATGHVLQENHYYPRGILFDFVERSRR